MLATSTTRAVCRALGGSREVSMTAAARRVDTRGLPGVTRRCRGRQRGGDAPARRPASTRRQAGKQQTSVHGRDRARRARSITVAGAKARDWKAPRAARPEQAGLDERVSALARGCWFRQRARAGSAASPITRSGQNSRPRFRAGGSRVSRVGDLHAKRRSPDDPQDFPIFGTSATSRTRPSSGSTPRVRVDRMPSLGRVPSKI